MYRAFDFSTDAAFGIELRGRIALSGPVRIGGRDDCKPRVLHERGLFSSTLRVPPGDWRFGDSRSFGFTLCGPDQAEPVSEGVFDRIGRRMFADS
jgi:hypothetical protein